MLKLLENSIFLRSLNYLRISHGYATRYNWVYPIIAGIISSTLLILSLSPQESLQKATSSFTSILAILAPFYIAALSAISTFSGPKQIDQPFRMKEPVVLSVIGTGGDWGNINVTPRHFLSLLFGYCTVLSIFLFLFSVFTGLFRSVLDMLDHKLTEYLASFLLFLFLSLISQLILCSLIGVYYLSDKIHRGKKHN